MEVLGFGAEDQDSIFRILASILHLGNVYFEKYEVRGGPGPHGPAPWGRRRLSRGAGAPPGLKQKHGSFVFMQLQGLRLFRTLRKPALRL